MGAYGESYEETCADTNEETYTERLMKRDLRRETYEATLTKRRVRRCAYENMLSYE